MAMLAFTFEQHCQHSINKCKIMYSFTPSSALFKMAMPVIPFRTHTSICLYVYLYVCVFAVQLYH